MKQLPMWLIVAGMSLPVSAWAAENRIINMVDCKLDEGMTIEDVQEVNGRWIRYMNKNVPGGDIRSFVVRAVIGDSEPSFLFIDSFPSLASWSAMVEAEDGDDKEIKEIMAALEKASTCSKNTLHRAEESE